VPDIFLSYSRDDQATARRFAEAFGREGLTVWWDQTLRSGENYDQVTESALREAKAVVVLWSKQSVDSRWVRAEATTADRAGTLVPAMIEACNRPIMFELKHTAELSQWKGDANDRRWLAFVNDVRQFVDRGATGAAVPALPSTVHPSRKSTGLKVAIAAAVLLAAGILLWWFNAGRNAATGPAAASATQAPTTILATPAAPATAVTLAVLPFADMSPAHDQDYFSDGLTEELLNQLANIKGLRVTARTSSFQFKGKSEDVRVIGEKLGVGNILEGSVRKDGNKLRITAQLINSRDGTHLWSQTYDRELSGVFALQEEVSKDVAKALSITLDVGALTREQGGTTNVEAYDRYLRARKAYHENGPVAGARAVRDLRDAVALDPQFARAWVLLSYALHETLIGVPDSQSAPVRKEADAAAERALELAPDSWWAQALRINKLVGQRKWAQAEAAMAAAMKAGTFRLEYAEATETYAYILNSLGRIAELVRIQRQARDVDPLSLYVSGDLQAQLDAAGLSGEAQAEYERSRTLSGNHQQSNIFALMRILARQDADPAAIRAQFRRLISEEVLPMSATHALAVKFDKRDQARTAISQAIDDPGNQDRVRMSVITMYADRFDQKDLALTAMRRASVDFRSLGALWLPMKTDLRSDPKFKQILRDVGLVDYFRSSGNWGDFCKPVGADDFECH
jgi:TolB-like protein